VACALELANKFPGNVFFVSGLDTRTKEEDSVMDIALETKWRNSSVQVVTVSRMRRELGKGIDVTVPELIHDFIEVHCNPPGEAVSNLTFIDREGIVPSVQGIKVLVQAQCMCRPLP
jgi:hypothetical protein